MDSTVLGAVVNFRGRWWEFLVGVFASFPNRARKLSQWTVASYAVKLMRHSETEEGAHAMRHYVKGTPDANVEAMQTLNSKTSKD